MKSQDTVKPLSSIFRVRAHNTAPDSENRIHDDRVAAAYGFRGGLVPGVTVYGYMVPPILEQHGREWVERGGIDVRFVAPCYEGETVVSRCDGSAVSAEDASGSLYASGRVTMDMGEDADAEPWALQVYTAHPAPEAERRPGASRHTITPGTRLGTIRRIIETGDPAAIPECLLHWANQILMANFVMSAWIHAGTQVRHHRSPALGSEITVTGAILECFERKGRRFAVAGLSFLEGEGPPAGALVAGVRHTFIYDLG